MKAKRILISATAVVAVLFGFTLRSRGVDCIFDSKRCTTQECHQVFDDDGGVIMYSDCQAHEVMAYYESCETIFNPDEKNGSGQIYFETEEANICVQEGEIYFNTNFCGRHYISLDRDTPDCNQLIGACGGPAVSSCMG